MTTNLGIYTDTAWSVPFTFTDTTGVLVNLAGAEYVADVISSSGAVAFRFKSTGGGATDGVIDKTLAASGVLTFSATIAQHVDVLPGLYRIHLKKDLSDDVWTAEGSMLVGLPGMVETYIDFDDPTSAITASISVDAATVSAAAFSASTSAASATASAAAALAAKTAAEGAAAASGNIVFYDTYALANAAVGGLANLQVVEVAADETRSGKRTRYRKESGVLAFKLILSATRIWYVSNSGNDSNAGLTEAAPELTLAAAAASATDGDIVRLARGSIWRETANFAAGVTIEPYGRGERPIISAQDVISSFTLDTGTTYTFTVSLTSVVANRGYAGVWENGVRMTEVTSIALCRSTVGSFFFAGPGDTASGWSAGTKTYYVNPGSNPGSNGKLYEAYVREYATNSNGLFKDIRIISGWGHNGSSQAMDGGSVERLARHGSLAAIPQFRNVTVIDDNPNPLYSAGGYFHSNPSSLQPDIVYEGCNAIGSTRNGIGFYTHGQTPGVLRRNRVSLFNCGAYNVAMCLGMDEVGRVDANGFKARNFLTLAEPCLNGSAYLRNVDAKGGDGSINSRLIGSTPQGPITIRDSRIEFYSSYMFFSGGTLPAIETYDTDYILRNDIVGGTTVALMWTNGTAAARFWAYRCRFIFPRGNNNWLINALSATDVQVRDCLLVGSTSNSTINSVTTPLETLDASARCIIVSPEKAIARDDEDGLTLYPGCYQPGDYIYSGVAHSGGTTQPRTYVAVGDRITISAFGTQNWTASYTPSSHLNGVCFTTAAGVASYIAVGNNGLIVKSDTNGGNWAVVGSGVTTQNLRAVHAMANSGTVVAVGDNGTVLRSTDAGATWALASTPGTTRSLYGVASNRAGTLWAACGAESRVIYSTDGNVWTEITVGTGTDTWRVAYRAGQDAQFLIGGDNGTCRTSTDAITWTARTVPTLNSIRGFAWGENTTVAICRQTTQFTDTFMESSDNGNTWTASQQTVPFELRSVVGPLNTMYNASSDTAYISMNFVAMGESMAVAARHKGTWSTRRILHNSVADTSQVMDGWLEKVR